MMAPTKVEQLPADFSLVPCGWIDAVSVGMGVRVFSQNDDLAT